MSDQIKNEIQRAMIKVMDETIEGVEKKTFKNLIEAVRGSIGRLANVAVAQVVQPGEGDVRINAVIGGAVKWDPGDSKKPITMPLDIPNTPQNLNVISQLDASRGLTLVGYYRALQTRHDEETPEDPRTQKVDPEPEKTPDGKPMPKWWLGEGTEMVGRDEVGLGFNAAARMQDKVKPEDLKLNGKNVVDDWNDGVTMFRHHEDKAGLVSHRCENNECCVDWFTTPDGKGVCPVCGVTTTQQSLPLSEQKIEPVFSDDAKDEALTGDGKDHDPAKDGPADPKPKSEKKPPAKKKAAASKKKAAAGK